MAHEHDVAGPHPDCLQDEPGDVVHALVELEVRFVVFEVLEGHLREVGGVHRQATLAQFLGGHESWEPPTTPGQPLEHAVFDPCLEAGVLQAVDERIGSLHTAQRWGAVDVGYSDALFPHSLPRQPGLEQPPLGDGRVFEELGRSSLPLGDLLGHVQVPAMVRAVRIEGELYPLLPKSDVHSLSMSEYEEPPGAQVLRGDGRGGHVLLFDLMPIEEGDWGVLGLPPLVHSSIQLLHVASLGEQARRAVVRGLVLPTQAVYAGH